MNNKIAIKLFLIFFIVSFNLLAEGFDDVLVSKGVIADSKDKNSFTTKFYWKGGSVVEFPDHLLTTKIQTQLQSRYEYSNADNRKAISSFSIKRARLIISGKALYKKLTYKVQTDFVGEKNNGVKVASLRDAYISWQTAEWTKLKIGQFKTPISRQFLSSSGKLQFADLSFVASYFELKRQLGIGIEANLNDKFFYGISIFNGQSKDEGRSLPGVDTRHTFGLSARSNIYGEMNPFSEGDVEYTERFSLNGGLGYAYSEDEVSMLGLIKKNSLSIDFNIKNKGTSVHSEFIYKNEDYLSSVSSSNYGVYVQGGYFVVPKKVEILFRYSYLNCDQGRSRGICVGNNKIDGFDIGLNYYWWKHHLKANLSYSKQRNSVISASSEESDKFLLQLNTYF